MVGAGYTIDEETEYIIKTKYPSRLLIIDSLADALRLFEDANALPRNTTQIRLQENNNLLLSGEFQQSRASLLIRAFSTSSGEAKIVKFTKDASNEFQMFQKTGLTPQQSLDYRLVPLETLIIDMHGKSAVVMPMLYCAIDLLKFPKQNKPENLLWNGFQDIMIAVSRLHEASIVHNDIKPANILVGAEGHWFLCDYGSCSRIGNRTSQTQIGYTPRYIPTDFQERLTERFDYLLLIVTILDRFTAGDFTRSDFTLHGVYDGISEFAHVELKDNLMALWNRCFQLNDKQKWV